MCTFLTVAVAKTRGRALESALRASGFDVEPQTNPQVAALFDADETLLLVTRGGCSCELKPPGPRADPAERLKRRGLSAGQLARALEATKGAGPSTTNTSASTLDRVLRAHLPVQTFFHVVSGSPRTESVRAGERPEPLK